MTNHLKRQTCQEQSAREPGCSEDIDMCSSERINCTKHLKRTLIALILNYLIIAFLTRRSSRSATDQRTC